MIEDWGVLTLDSTSSLFTSWLDWKLEGGGRWKYKIWLYYLLFDIWLDLRCSAFGEESSHLGQKINRTDNGHYLYSNIQISIRYSVLKHSVLGFWFFIEYYWQLANLLFPLSSVENWKRHNRTFRLLDTVQYFKKEKINEHYSTWIRCVRACSTFTRANSALFSAMKSSFVEAIPRWRGRPRKRKIEIFSPFCKTSGTRVPLLVLNGIFIRKAATVSLVGFIPEVLYFSFYSLQSLFFSSGPTATV